MLAVLVPLEGIEGVVVLIEGIDSLEFRVGRDHRRGAHGVVPVLKGVIGHHCFYLHFLNI